MRRNHIANFLEITLVVIIIAVAAAGFFSYKNLNQIVSQLETQLQPNNSLLLYKEILLTLHAMENQAEAYKISEDETNLNRYYANVNMVETYLDSLNKINANDKDVLIFNDSLSSLISRKTEILNELLKLRPENPSSNLTALKQKLKEIPDIIKEDTVLDIEPKKGFLTQLFNRSQEKEAMQDSLLRARADQYQTELNEKIEQLKQSSEYTARIKRQKEMRLETAHFEIQNQIMDLIGYLEFRETVKMKINSVNAQELAYNTNEQIILFISLAILLLIMSVFVMISYVRRNHQYQLLLQESKKSVENLARAKERFFANMSHEIRTPMNAISGFTKILLKSDLEGSQKEQVEIIHKSSDHLLKLLNDILDFSKLQAEKLQLEQVSFDLKEVCQESIKLMEENARKKNIRLISDYQDLPKTVLGDPYRLRQILLNLLNNSIKFTDKGEVKLKVSAKKTKETATVHIIVSDTGKGIPKDRQHKLFQEFEQADQSSFSQGTGLGLAITKRLVMLHDSGKIDLHSDEGKGTSIHIRVRYEISKEIPEAVVHEVNEPALRLDSIRVLIADDEPFNVKLLATLLKKHDISYDEAYDGKQAYNLLNKNAYDIVLLDLKMPEMTGWQIVESIKSNPGPNRDKPFIALTATISQLDLKKGQQLGFDHIMRKPFDENELFEFISKHTGRDLSVEEHAQTQSTAEIDLSSLLSMGDQHFVDDMVQTFITGSTEGLEAIKLHVRKEEYREVALLAHRIVAPARHFKAKTLVKKLKRLQSEAEKNPQGVTPEMVAEIETELDAVIESINTALQKEIAKL